MSLLAPYVEALRAGDAEKVASVFSEDGLFHDEAPKTFGLDPIIARGRAAIIESFGALLAGGGLSVENVVFNENAMRYDIVMGPDTTVKCLGVYREQDGKITEYYVTAAGR